MNKETSLKKSSQSQINKEKSLKIQKTRYLIILMDPNSMRKNSKETTWFKIQMRNRCQINKIQYLVIKELIQRMLRNNHCLANHRMLFHLKLERINLNLIKSPINQTKSRRKNKTLKYLIKRHPQQLQKKSLNL